MTPMRMLGSFLMAALVLGLLNGGGLVRWSRDVHPASLSDALVPLAEAWDGLTVSLGADAPYREMREGLERARGWGKIGL